MASPDAAAVGFAEGNLLPDLSLVGYVDRNHDEKLTDDEHGPLRPSEVIASHPAAEVLLIHVAFGWCKYCWEETAAQIRMSKGYGGRFVSIQVLVDDRNGVAATKTFEDEWIEKNKSALITALEPEGTLLKQFGHSATYLMVDAKDRRLLVVGAGPPTFEHVRRKIEERLGPLP